MSDVVYQGELQITPYAECVIRGISGMRFAGGDSGLLQIHVSERVSKRLGRISQKENGNGINTIINQKEREFTQAILLTKFLSNIFSPNSISFALSSLETDMLGGIDAHFQIGDDFYDIDFTTNYHLIYHKLNRGDPKKRTSGKEKWIVYMPGVAVRKNQERFRQIVEQYEKALTDEQMRIVLLHELENSLYFPDCEIHSTKTGSIIYSSHQGAPGFVS